MKKTFHKNEIEIIAHEILSQIKGGESATIVALSGDLGAGKTTLTQAIARQLGITENVISPTFIIMKNYAIKKGPHEKLVHIDAYRLNSEDEMLRLGWDELIADSKNLILIEWPEQVPNLIPAHAHKIKLTHKNEEEREIET